MAKLIEKESKKSFLVLVPSLILLHQFSKTLDENQIKHKLYGTNLTEQSLAEETTGQTVDVCVYNSVEHLIKNHYDYIIIDEAHKVWVPKVLEE